METYNSFAEVAAACPSQNSVSPTCSAVTNNVDIPPPDRNKIAELVAPTIRDIVQFKTVAGLCPDFAPVAKFAMEDESLRLVQVTFVNPEYASLARGLIKDLSQ